MIKRFFALVIALFIGIAMMALTVEAQKGEPRYIPDNSAQWILKEGDWIIANVVENKLVFVRADNSEFSKKVEIGSGINDGKNIYYLGMYYDPKTPEETWEIRSKEQQNWWNVFGSRESDEQLFLRMYRVRGKQRIRSYYGIHTTPDIETIFREKGGFGTWGCLLARYDLLKMIEHLLEINKGVIKVITTSKKNEELISFISSSS